MILLTGDRRGAALKLVVQAREAVLAVEAVLRDAIAAVRGRLNAQPADTAFDREQRATHGLAWLATYVEALRQLASYADRLHAEDLLGETEQLLIEIGLGEYLAEILGGIPMSQGEMVRP